jgi:hypothetical protein
MLRSVGVGWWVDGASVMLPLGCRMSHQGDRMVTPMIGEVMYHTANGERSCFRGTFTQIAYGLG